VKINYCVECAAPLVQQTPTHYICENEHDFWNNPKPAVGVVLIKDNKVLFARRALPPFKDKYDLPGGFVDFGETIFEAARRELMEEAGIELGEMVIIGSTMQAYGENISICDLVLVADNWQGEPEPGDDVLALEWKPLEFINSNGFAWNYSGIVPAIESHLRKGL
jgi:ADP-ribose pyrophosphatase YjhB (NUDIX family)